MKSKSFFGFLLSVLILTACESSVTNPPTSNQTNATLEYSGGLNISFDKNVSKFLKSVKTIHQENDSYILDIQFHVETLDETQRQQASVQFDIPFNSSGGIFPVGNYVLTEEQIKLAYGDYELLKNNSDFARYNFDGSSATLVVNESNSEFISGSFILNMEQLSGKRMTDGQLEDVVLSAPIRMLSDFNLEF